MFAVMNGSRCTAACPYGGPSSSSRIRAPAHGCDECPARLYVFITIRSARREGRRISRRARGEPAASFPLESGVRRHVEIAPWTRRSSERTPVACCFRRQPRSRRANDHACGARYFLRTHRGAGAALIVPLEVPLALAAQKIPRQGVAGGVARCPRRTVRGGRRLRDSVLLAACRASRSEPGQRSGQVSFSKARSSHRPVGDPRPRRSIKHFALRGECSNAVERFDDVSSDQRLGRIGALLRAIRGR